MGISQSEAVPSNTKVSQPSGLDSLVQELYGTFQHVQALDMLHLAVLDRNHQTIQVNSFDGKQQTRLSVINDPEQELLAYLIAQGRPISWQDLPEYSVRSRCFPAHTPASFMGVPVTGEGRVLGALCLQADSPYVFDDETMKSALKMARRTALSLHYSQILTQAERRRQEMTLVNEVGRMLAVSLDYDHFQQLMSQRFDTSSIFIGLYDPQRGDMRFPLSVEDGLPIPDDDLPLQALFRAVIQQENPLHCQDLRAERARLVDLGITLEALVNISEAGVRSWLGVPLHNRYQEVCGVLALSNMLPNSYSDEDLALLTTIAAQLSLALENRQLVEFGTGAPLPGQYANRRGP